MWKCDLICSEAFQIQSFNDHNSLISRNLGTIRGVLDNMFLDQFSQQQFSISCVKLLLIVCFLQSGEVRIGEEAGRDDAL